MKRIIQFTGSFTGVLSKLDGVSFSGAKLRIEKGQRYILKIDDKNHVTLTPVRETVPNL